MEKVYEVKKKPKLRSVNCEIEAVNVCVWGWIAMLIDMYAYKF